MKLELIKLANAVPCPSKTETTFSDKEYIIEEYDNFKVKITNRVVKYPDGRPCTVHTSLFNAVFWRYVKEEEDKIGSKPSQQPDKRSSKA
jgi:hypothetical protein